MKDIKKHGGKLFGVLLFAFVNLIALVGIKYYLNDLTLGDFKLDFLGNIFNCITFFLVGLGLFSYQIRYKKIDNKLLLILFILLAAALIPLIFIFLITKNFFVLKNTSFLNFPIKKVLTAVLFVVHQLLLFFVLFLLWIAFLDSGKISYLRPLIAIPVTISLLMVFAYGYTLLDKRKNTIKKEYDFGIVFGAAVWSKDKPSPIFEGRILRAKELLDNRTIKKIFLTGGNAPGELSESETAFLYLKKKGVDTTKIFFEKDTRTTLEQIKYLKLDLIPRFKTRSILLISDKFHLSRVLDICNFFNIKSDAVASEHQLTEKSAINYRVKESVALLFFWFFAI